ncbi:BPL-N domain-containing protein [Amycolatopsis jiangsuensis]|uniref:Glutamine amidotransferase-like uncharacterized protein n=1 Tax=Amycolatopsis jiangsuensis TaxID=1181879 RepID=A0A840IQI1_9PSEU|nr:BPL-N domain-containing protein [Amycolatopsis jiangsuensis]MBB4683438.1 glutamine amidotransferase-like uncharacterized protein [Amycolatopsis jiangsuensis]
MDRRRFLLGAGVLTGAAGLTAAGITVFAPDSRPLALVYRGPASTEGCPEAVAALLGSQYRVAYTGPDEEYPLTADSLAKAALYAQPGGGGLDPAWRRMREHAGDLRDYVRGGGNYLGFCLGGYLAGRSPGFGFLPGDTDQYIGSQGAHLRSTRDTVLPVTWRGERRQMYFQDGPLFTLEPSAPATVLATYPTGAVAAAVTPYGKGKVGVVGPHPEADESWFHDARLNSAGALHPELGRDLVATTVAR